MGLVVETVAVLTALAVVIPLANFRVVKRYERGVVYRFGRVLDEVRQPGLRWLIPVADRLQKVWS